MPLFPTCNWCQINQEGDKNVLDSLEHTVQLVLEPMVKCSPGVSSRIVNKLLSAATQFEGKAMDLMEERRAKWTTFRTIDRWFDEWERQLLQLGFAVTDEAGVSFIAEEQRKRIINIDETALSFDGAEGRCGGRHAIQFTDPNLQAS